MQGERVLLRPLQILLEVSALFFQDVMASRRDVLWKRLVIYTFFVFPALLPCF